MESTTQPQMESVDLIVIGSGIVVQPTAIVGIECLLPKSNRMARPRFRKDLFRSQSVIPRYPFGGGAVHRRRLGEASAL